MLNTIIFDRRLAEMNKNQRQMAEDIDMRPQRISDMKAGRLMGWKYQRRISRYLGIPEDLLFLD